MRVAVIGCGYWGSKHIRVLTGLTEASAVLAVDKDPHRLHATAAAYRAVEIETDVHAAARWAGAAVIATPPRTHYPLALRLIRAGKHVLVEKPLAMNGRDARHLRDEAQRRGVTLMVGHTFAYNAAVRRLREGVDQGELGPVEYVHSARLNLGLYQDDVNVLWDLAPHDVSILNYVLDSTPTEVHAWGVHQRAHVEDVAYLRLDYEDRRVSAQVHVSWLDPCKVRRLTVVGGERMAVYDDMAQEERLRIYDRGVAAVPTENGEHGVPMSYRYGSILSPFIPFEEPLVVQDRHFLQSIANGATPLTDGANGIAVVDVLEASEQSLRERRPVALRAPAPGPPATPVAPTVAADRGYARAGAGWPA